MKLLMNFTTSPDDEERYQDPTDLKNFYCQYHCSGLELMPLGQNSSELVTPDMITGVHARCISDWMNLDQDQLLLHYRADLDFAESVHAEYVVFHVTQVSYLETLTNQPGHTDAEVIAAVCPFINALLDGQNYHFYFLMENLWWPGLNFLDPEITAALLNGVHYSRKGLMLDTGHLMNTNIHLHTPEQAVQYLNTCLDQHQSLLPMIKGLHLNQSLSGHYMRNYLTQADISFVPGTPEELSGRAFEHIFRIDQHLPFTDPGAAALVKRIDPLYVNLEYITRSREEHAAYLSAGTAALSIC